MRKGYEMVAATLLGMVLLSVGSRASADPGQCRMGSGDRDIEHVVYLQFDNVHLRRDIPNVPSDLEQMPNLLRFLRRHGSILTNHHTPLISHTSVDILTSMSGLYGDRMGLPVGNSYRFFKPDGTTSSLATFAYWTDPADNGVPQMVGADGKIAPAPWVPYTRAGCDVGAFSIANIELENVGNDVNTVFGPNSPEAAEAKNDPGKAVTDIEGIAIHCAKGSALCSGGQDDKLTDEPGGYDGYRALFGAKYVGPAITADGKGNVTDLDGNVIADSKGNPGFPNTFNPSASQSLGYMAQMLEAGVPVVYGYIADAHDNHFAGSGTYGPGEAGYELQLAAYNKAFGEFFDRLAGDGITPDNTLFVITSDENDKFVGSDPVPANCDGVHIPCTYPKIGEVNVDLSRLVATETGNVTPFTVHSDSAPAIYITGNPGQTDAVTRGLERSVAGLTALNPITGNVDLITAGLVDHTEMSILHMMSSDVARNPTFILFGDDNYFIFSTNSTLCDAQHSSCVTEPPGFAWNHGDFQETITRTFLGMVGPGIAQQGENGSLFSDHADIRPTMMSLLGLHDDYASDGRVLAEMFLEEAVPDAVTAHWADWLDLAITYKQINAPLDTLGRRTLTWSTRALKGNDRRYAELEAEIADATLRRDWIAGQMAQMLEDSEFNGTPIDVQQARNLIDQADDLLATFQ